MLDLLHSVYLHVEHELCFSNLGAVAFTLVALLLYTAIGAGLLVGNAWGRHAIATILLLLEIMWQLYSRYVLVPWLDESRLPKPNQSEWAKAAEYLSGIFSHDSRAIWEHICEDRLENISRETALDVLDCLAPFDGDYSVQDSKPHLDLLDKLSPGHSFPKRGSRKSHRLVGLRDSIAPFCRHLPLAITGVGGFFD